MSVAIGTGQSSSSLPATAHGGDDADAAAFAALLAQPPQAGPGGGGVAGKVNAFYQGLLGQDADPRALADIGNALAAGQSLDKVEADLRPTFARSDAATAAVNGFYQQSFGQAATPGELDTIEGALAGGQSLFRIEAALDPAGTSGNPTLAAINDFYQRLFGRNALPQEADSFVDAMAGGQSVQASVAALRPAFAKSDAEAGTINAFYKKSFDRAATSDELVAIEGALSAGQSLLGIEARLDPDSTSANPTLGAINDLYQRLFGRNALPHEVDGFVDAMAGGQSVQASVAALRPVFAKSDAEANTINAFYRAVAGRPAHPDELLNIEGALAAGQALDDIEAAQAPGLLAEARAQRQARADAADATYRQVLNRGASAAELSDREREFANGQTMGGMRDGLAHSPEAAADIDRVYQDLFGHGVDGPSLGVIQAQLAAGASLGDLRGTFARTSPAVGSAIADAFGGAGRRAPSGPELDYWRSRLAEGGSLGDLRAALAEGRATDYLAFHPGLSPGFFPAPIPYHPAIDPEQGYAPPAEPVTLLGADGTVLASNAARDVLAVLPVYVTLNGGQSPSLRLGDGSTLRFSNAVELAGYLQRTAQRASPNDPLLGTAYGQTSAWLQQVDQPVLETAIRYAQLARNGDPAQANLHRAASGLALQILQQDPGQRHALSTKLQQDGHETVVTVAVDGTATFHDKDPGPWGVIEAVATILADFLAAFPPTSGVGIPLAVALNAAQAGQALADGNVLGGVLSLGTAATFGTGSLVVSVATRVAGGVSAIVQGAQRGDAAGIIGGVLATAGGAAAGLGMGGAGFSLGDGPGAVTVDLQHALSAAGALTSFGAQVAQGRVTDGLLNSLGPWLAGLHAESYAKGNSNRPNLEGSISQGDQISHIDPSTGMGFSVQRADPYQVAGISDFLSFFRGQDPDLLVNYTGQRLLQIASQSQQQLGIDDPTSPSAAVYGSRLHKMFADNVKSANIDGISPTDVETSFEKGGVEIIAGYGSPGSLRTDVILRDPATGILKAVFDLKPETGPLTTQRIGDIRERITGDRNSPLPVYSIRYVRGGALGS